VRDLTKKQKRLIGKWMTENQEIWKAEDLTDAQWQTLEDINNTEVLYQNVNCFIRDSRMDGLYEKKRNIGGLID